ncbi:exopolysaccharide biosynthesis protein [Methanobrevibacter arboriphilus]|uniref:Exopolysaccharide biosynthesis protein n=2 Tax=Methanobrevibacter arboriphilus TaxID=39441 RepID=A0ACA8R6K0_METAZ|nr:exopolysaccharide biosynthesis protein [Methanobrevibacter arboriphilus]GLI12143.1 exopolysaccharide biosynthesis protein [Methanobrevibacter arboriphilus]
MENNGNITIYVISHNIESIKMAKNDDLYTPLFVGAEKKDTLGFLADNTGDNISNKNKDYAELTGFYWMCKNSKSEIIGLNHYRRYLSKSKFGKLLNYEDITYFLKEHDLIIPKIYKNLDSLSNYENFTVLNINDPFVFAYDTTREIIREKTPEYLDAFDYVMKSNLTTHSNIFIGHKELMNRYADWIFPLLFELENRINLNDYPPRLMGYLTEIYFQVWIKHLDLKVKEVEPKFIGFNLNLSKFLAKNPLIRKFYEVFIIPYKKKRYITNYKKY